MRVKFFTAVLIITKFCCCLTIFAQQSEISVTVYNRNLALIRDVRQIQVQKGEQLINFRDVAAQIDPTSVHLRSLTAPNSFFVLEQNFEYDLVSSAKILRKYIDQKIELFTSAKDTIRGILLSSGNEIVLELPAGEIRMIQKRDIRSMNFPRLPEGLITRPTLIWLVESKKKQNHRIETEYLTNGITWHTEYVSILNSRETEMDITAWVSVNNRSGGVYNNARLKLVAGDIHLADEPVRSRFQDTKIYQLAAETTVQEKEFFEYHLYTVNRPTTLNNNQIKQITLFDAPGVKVAKKYVYDGLRWPTGVRIYTRFKNEADNNLGMPFPAGKFRVYKKDSDGGMIFLGEDRINHTPKDEWIETFLGNVFDVKAERKKNSSKNIGSNQLRETYEIVIRNHKKETITVNVIEHFDFRYPVSEWKIVESSHSFTKMSARTAEFLIKTDPNQEIKLRYTVDYSW